MSTEIKINAMAEMKANIVTYLEEQRDITLDALKAYDNDSIKDSDPEIRKMRESEAIKLRDRVNELKRHIAVIKLM